MIWCSRDLVRNPYHVGLCLSPKNFKKELKRIGADEDLVFTKSPQSDATTWIIKDGEGKEVIIVCVKNSKSAAFWRLSDCWFTKQCIFGRQSRAT